MTAKAYSSVPIHECGEPLIAIPGQPFAFCQPHAYEALGAPYDGVSPWQLRRPVCLALVDAARRLAERQPGWRLRLFDAYRPLAVQAHMVWREFGLQAGKVGASLAGLDTPAALARHDPALHDQLAATVYTFWGLPSDDPATPPPHSTGAAVDLTLEDENGCELDMGGLIDETTERSFPDHYAGLPGEYAARCDTLRRLLNAVMTEAGFRRHRHEWWHFSMGDQMAALAGGEATAIYGRADLLATPGP